MEPTRDAEPVELSPVELNPYAPPEVPIGARVADPTGEPDAIRRHRLGRENAVKLAGAFCYLGAILMVAVASLTPLGFRRPPGVDDSQYVARLIGQLIGMVLVALIPIGVGNGLKGLRSWARWTVVALAPIALVYWTFVGVGGVLAAVLAREVPAVVLALGIFGCIFAAITLFMLVALLRPGTGALFTPEYRAIVAATPHIKAWAEWIMRGFLAVFVVVLLALLVLILRQV